MNAKKAWYNYIIYIFFTMLTAVSLTEYILLIWSGSYIASGTNAFTKWMISSQFNYRSAMGFFIFAVYAVLVILFCVITVISRKFKKKHQLNSHVINAWEYILIFAITAGGLIYKICSASDNMPAALHDMSYFKLAQVGSGSSFPSIQHGMSMLYLYVLSFFMSFLGNKIMTAVVLQIFLQTVSIIVMYFAVKLWTGRIPAFFVCAVYAFSSLINEKLYEANPECLLFLIWCLMLLLCGAYCRSTIKNKDKKMFIPAVLLGAAVGTVCYLDIFGFTLFVFLLFLFVENAGSKKLYRIIDYFIIAVTSAAVIILLIWMKSTLCGNSFSGEFSVWSGIIKNSLKIQPYMYSSDSRFFSMAECFVIIYIAAMFIPAFWLHDTDHAACFEIMLAVAWTPMTGIGILTENIFSIFIWSVMAGIGLQSMTVHMRTVKSKTGRIHKNRSRKVTIQGSDINNASKGVTTGTAANDSSHDQHETAGLCGNVHRSQAGSMGSEQPIPYMMVEGSSITPNSYVERLWNEINSTGSGNDMGKADSASDIKKQTEKKPVKYIKNPLPLPPKHEKKQIEFNHDVPESDMDFDVNINENDNFDHK